MRTTLTLDQIVREWITGLDIFETTREDYHRKIGLWFRWLGSEGIELRSPGRQHILAYKKHLQAQGKSHFTTDSYVTVVKLFYRHCATMKYYENIGAGVKSSTRFKEHTRQPLTRDEAARLLDSIDTATIIGKRDKLMIALMLTNGLRSCEIARIDLPDFIHGRQGSLLNIQRKGRTDKRETIAVTPFIERLKDDYLKSRAMVSGSDAPLFTNHAPGNSGTRLSRLTITQIIKARLRAIGIDRPEITAHSLRHTCGSLLVESGVEIETIRNMLGHTDTATTRIYIEMAAKRKILENSPANIIEGMLLKK